MRQVSSYLTKLSEKEAERTKGEYLRHEVDVAEIKRPWRLQNVRLYMSICQACYEKHTVLMLTKVVSGLNSYGGRHQVTTSF